MYGWAECEKLKDIQLHLTVSVVYDGSVVGLALALWYVEGAGHRLLPENGST
jgi:hypothetical protein